MKYKIIIVVVSVLIGGIGGGVISSCLHKPIVLYKNNQERKESNEQFEKDLEEDEELIRQGSVARIDYPLIDIYFDKSKKYKIIATVPSGRGITPEYILRVYEENDCIKTLDCITIRTDFFDE